MDENKKEILIYRLEGVCHFLNAVLDCYLIGIKDDVPDIYSAISSIFVDTDNFLDKLKQA